MQPAIAAFEAVRPLGAENRVTSPIPCMSRPLPPDSTSWSAKRECPRRSARRWDSTSTDWADGDVSYQSPRRQLPGSVLYTDTIPRDVFVATFSGDTRMSTTLAERSPIPSHVPPDRVADFDILTDPVFQGDP